MSRNAAGLAIHFYCNSPRIAVRYQVTGPLNMPATAMRRPTAANLTHDELNYPADAWVDYVHPSDLGAQAQATAVEKKVREILK